jgi:Calcineurin-like phosphoesterase
MKRLLLLAALLPALSLPGASRDWAKYPAVTEIASAEEIFAIGDAHSDFTRLARAMVAAGIIDAQPVKPSDARWRAGHAVLVTTGDMIDKGPRALDVLRLLMSIRIEARRAGGDVVILAGNHEAEFLADPTAPKGKEFAKQLKAEDIDPMQVSACKGEIGSFLCSLSFAARVGDWFFSHGGNTGGRTIAQLTADLQAGLDHEGYRTKQLIGEDSLLESKLTTDAKGRKVWIHAGMPDSGERQLLAAYAKALGVSHLVMGHVPTEVAFADGVKRGEGEMFQRFGLLFLIDTGMSEGVDNSGGAVLHITFRGGEKATAICSDGRRTLLWDSSANQDFGRSAPCPK